MSKRLDDAVGLVKAYLEENNYSYSITMSNLRCFRLFEVYLEEEKKTYSNSVAIQWFKGVSTGLCDSTQTAYKLALSRLDAAYHGREIKNTKSQYEERQKYQHLESWSKEVLDSFMEEIPSEYDCSFIRTIRVAVARFLDYLQCRGITRLGDISHRIIADYYRDDKHDSYKSKDVYNNCVRKFLHYLSENGTIQASLPLTLDKFVLSHMVFIELLPSDEQEAFCENAGVDSISTEEYYRASLELHTVIEHENYSKSMKKVFRQAWKEFFIFLEANSLNYTQGTAFTWANYMSKHVSQWKTFRRAFKLFDQYWSTGIINPRIVYNYKPDRAENLPKWCKADYEKFILLKQKEGVAESTQDMYRSSCLRLLEYLDEVGIYSWEAITPETLKVFHYQDAHSTPEARNAYSSKIRAFLEYLGEISCVSPTLFLAVPSECATRVNLINILNDKALADLTRYQEKADNAYKLRDVAMILIGLRMGLRASDITKIRFVDISWEQKTISVLQQKTGKFIKLPMPVEVGNALYRYIIYGRPVTTSEYVFISHRVPFDRLNRVVCRKALLNALPSNSHGFRVVRKTFASRMLVKDVSADRIAETLGHADNSTVMQYLSTNDEKMRQCALSLTKIPVRGGALL